MKLEARLATSTARSIPLSSMTVRRSSIHSSIDGSSDAGTGSDRPVPRLSKVSTRPKLGTHLLPEGTDVHRRPVLDQPAVADPEDVDELELHALSRRRQVPEFTEVRPPECLAGRDEVALGELLVDLHGG